MVWELKLIQLEKISFAIGIAVFIIKKKQKTLKFTASFYF